MREKQQFFYSVNFTEQKGEEMQRRREEKRSARDVVGMLSGKLKTMKSRWKIEDGEVVLAVKIKIEILSKFFE